MSETSSPSTGLNCEVKSSRIRVDQFLQVPAAADEGVATSSTRTTPRRTSLLRQEWQTTSSKRTSLLHQGLDHILRGRPFLISSDNKSKKDTTFFTKGNTNSNSSTIMPKIDCSNLPTSYRGKKNTTSLFDSRRLKTTAQWESPTHGWRLWC